MDILKFLFPPKCINCGIYSTYLCKYCKDLLIPTIPECHICHKISNNYTTHLDCKNINKYEDHLSNVTTFWKYNELASKLLSEYKYNGVTDLYDLLQQLIEERALEMDLSHLTYRKNIFITNIPQHIFRTKERGFEPTKQICKILLTLNKNWIYIPDLLTKSRNNKRQATLDHKFRDKNSQGLYKLDERRSEEIPTGSQVIIIDDVTTSGSTLRYASDAIFKKRPDILLSGLLLFDASK